MQLISPEKVSRKLQIFAADDDDLHAAQDLLSNDGSQAAQQMTAAVDNDSLK